NGTLPVAIDAQDTFLAGRTKQIDDRCEAVAPFVESLDRASEMLLRLTDVQRIPRRRRVGERPLHGTDAVLQAHRRRRHLFLVITLVVSGVLTRLWCLVS